MNVALFLNLILALLAAVQPAENAVLAGFQQKLASGLVFKTALSIVEKHPESKEPSVFNGTLWLAGSGYRLEINDRIYVVSGNESTVYEVLENRLIISPYEEAEDDFAPAKYLTGQPAGYKVTESRKGTVIQFKSTEPGLPYESVELTFDKTGLPQKLTAKDEWGGKISISFTGPTLTTMADWKKLQVPADAEQIDLRQQP